MLTRLGDALLGVSIGIAGAYLCFSYNELGYVTKDHLVGRHDPACWIRVA